MKLILYLFDISPLSSKKKKKKVKKISHNPSLTAKKIKEIPIQGHSTDQESPKLLIL